MEFFNFYKDYSRVEDIWNFSIFTRIIAALRQ